MRLTSQDSAVMEKTQKPATPGSYSILHRREENPDPEHVLAIPCADAFSVIVQLRDFAAHKLWRGRELVFAGGHACQSLSIAYLGDELHCQHQAGYDNLRFTFPSAPIQALLYESGGAGGPGFKRVLGQVDPVVYCLSQALLPTLTTPGQTNQLFVDQVMLAMLTHLDQHYGAVVLAREGGKGLANWQLRRAKELIASHLAEGLSVARLAEECSLSRSYFTRAFKRSTGLSPHDWLLKMRVEKAKTLMRDSSLCLSQIGLECGFSDQSHFSRVFLKLTGSAPANWRRLQRTGGSW
ncbi:helix-turn-helix domain-containing protein [Pseudomonas sp. X10]